LTSPAPIYLLAALGKAPGHLAAALAHRALIAIAKLPQMQNITPLSSRRSSKRHLHPEGI